MYFFISLVRHFFRVYIFRVVVVYLCCSLVFHVVVLFFMCLFLCLVMYLCVAYFGMYLCSSVVRPPWGLFLLFFSLFR